MATIERVKYDPETQTAEWPGTPPEQPPRDKPNDHIVRGVMGCIFGILPLSVVGIVFAGLANSRWGNGQYASAENFFRKADRFTKLSLQIGIPLRIALVVMFTIFYLLLFMVIYNVAHGSLDPAVGISILIIILLII